MTIQTHYIPLPQPQAVYYPKDSFLFQRIGTLAAVSARENGTLKVEHHPVNEDGEVLEWIDNGNVLVIGRPGDTVHRGSSLFQKAAGLAPEANCDHARKILETAEELAGYGVAAVKDPLPECIRVIIELGISPKGGLTIRTIKGSTLSFDRHGDPERPKPSEVASAIHRLAEEAIPALFNVPEGTGSPKVEYKVHFDPKNDYLRFIAEKIREA